MIPTSFDYVRAGSLRDALSALAQGDGTKVIAGGHSLLPMMKFRLAQPTRLLDIGGLDELAGRRGVPARRPHRRARPPTASCSSRELLRERFPIIASAPRTSATSRSGTAAPSAAAWRTPIRPPTCRRSCSRWTPASICAPSGASARSRPGSSSRARSPPRWRTTSSLLEIVVPPLPARRGHRLPELRTSRHRAMRIAAAAAVVGAKRERR